MNTIVIAAIVLIVLVVLIMIFTGNIGGWTKNVDEAQQSFEDSCLNKGGRLVKEENLPDNPSLIPASDDNPEGGLFCLK